LRLVITDSGLGGLSVCAALDAALRVSPVGVPLHITYFNVWPEKDKGYNDLSDMTARARVFDRALNAVDALAPDRILIACNTLSIVYEWTDHARRPGPRVQGIVGAGVAMFVEALSRRRTGSLVLVGTRTTVDSGVHRERLVAHGVAADRIGAASCHGLATAIENGPASDTTDALIGTCAERAAGAAPPGDVLLAGLCCTHYGIVGERFGTALERRTSRPVELLDPNVRLVQDVTAELLGPGMPGRDRQNDAGAGEPSIEIDVISKVALGDAKRAGCAAVLEPVSPSTARALRSYNHVPGLF
jgi:glutamate racemase